MTDSALLAWRVCRDCLCTQLRPQPWPGAGTLPLCARVCVCVCVCVSEDVACVFDHCSVAMRCMRHCIVLPLPVGWL
jgi:hypothetical protein